MDDGVLDATTRRELDALRRRAYGPSPDILADPAAVTRLAHLEERAHPATSGEDAADGAASIALAPPARQARPAWHVALIAGCGVVALAFGAFAAIAAVRRTGTAPTDPLVAATEVPGDVLAFAQAATTRVLARLPVEGALRGAVPTSDGDALPAFPTDDPLLWVDPVGQYFGVPVWIARTVDGRACVLVELRLRDRALCVDEQHFAASALLVTVPFAELAEGTRPTRMTPAESFGVWWRQDRPIELLIGPTPGSP